MHDIQKNVPVPKPTREAPPPRRKYPFDELEVNDMFFVSGRDKNTLTTHVSMVGRKLKRKFVTRLTKMVETRTGWRPCKTPADEKNAVQGIGVWRVE